jgi:hypothetical protein
METEKSSEVSLLINFFIALDVITHSKVSPAVEADTTLRVFAHFGHVFLDVLQRRNRAYTFSQSSMP